MSSIQSEYAFTKHLKSSNFFSLSVLSRSERYFMDNVLVGTPYFGLIPNSIDGISFCGKNSLYIEPSPFTLIFQSTAVPSPVPYTCLFLYCNSNDCSSSSRMLKSVAPAYSTNVKSLFSLLISILGWKTQFVPFGYPCFSFTTIIVTDVHPLSIFLLNAVILSRSDSRFFT